MESTPQSTGLPLEQLLQSKIKARAAPAGPSPQLGVSKVLTPSKPGILCLSRSNNLLTVLMKAKMLVVAVEWHTTLTLITKPTLLYKKWHTLTLQLMDLVSKTKHSQLTSELRVTSQFLTMMLVKWKKHFPTNPLISRSKPMLLHSEVTRQVFLTIQLVETFITMPSCLLVGELIKELSTGQSKTPGVLIGARMDSSESLLLMVMASAEPRCGQFTQLLLEQ
jgi:hypothetical protein